MTKTMNEQMEELEAEIKEGNEDYYSTKEVDILEARKSQLQTDMKIVEELKEKLKTASEDNDWEVATNDGQEDGFIVISGKDFIDKLFTEVIGK